jgi:hypothetical protein
MIHRPKIKFHSFQLITLDGTFAPAGARNPLNNRTDTWNILFSPLVIEDGEIG